MFVTLDLTETTPKVVTSAGVFCSRNAHDSDDANQFSSSNPLIKDTFQYLLRKQKGPGGNLQEEW